ncbi:hypothetical protein LRY58_01720 [Candidatus Woesebacteria bacterium]|nr:hypothetical protein [Candidatus Woesebacteria bacterium]MCD8546660.1 hypothetical protein [Candidatus Woesebacteria bacterium]
MAFSFVHQSWQSAELRDRQLLPSRESRRQNSATTSLSIHGGIKHWLREMVQQRQARQRNTAEQTTHSSQSQNTELASNFRLIDVLTSLSQRVLENPKILAKDSPERFQLEAMMREQIQAFVAEQLGLPYHSYANEVDLGKWVSDNTLETFHPKYADTETRGDLLNMARKAATVNTGAEGDRYRREQTQLEVLYHEKLTAELTNWQNESTWTPTTAGNLLSENVRTEYGLTNQEEIIYVGKKYALAMPENSQVYPEGKAYTNLHQLVYIPSQNRVLLLIEQWFDEHTYNDQAFILNSWEEDAIPDSVMLTEDILMSTLVTLPSEVQTSPAFEVFANMARQLDANQQDTQFRLNQQARLGLLHANKTSMHQAATFLTQVLITEYLVCLEYPEALSDLSARLWGAYEMMAHPFLSGHHFIYEATLKSYMDGYLGQWIHATAHLHSPQLSNSQLANRERRQTIHRRIEQQLHRRSAQEQHHLTSQQKEQRNSALQLLANNGYTNILQRVASEAWCATGNVGGLTQVSQTLNSSLGQSVMNGHFVNMNELSQLIGQDRAEKWQMGVCENPNCPRGTVTQLVGECGFCIHCELLSQSGQELTKRGEHADSDLARLNQFAKQPFLNPDDVSNYYRRHLKIGVDILPTYLLAGEQVLR